MKPKLLILAAQCWDRSRISTTGYRVLVGVRVIDATQQQDSRIVNKVNDWHWKPMISNCTIS